MGKELILAVAGSGKTSYIIDKLDLEKQNLVITYTINNLNNLKVRIIKKWGYLPNNIRLFSYFTFIYSFCYKPYLHKKYSSKGIRFTHNQSRYAKNQDRYIDDGMRLYSNRISKLLEAENVLPDIEKRLSKYFDQILIDEVQDFAGHDFNFLESIIKADSDIVMTGDFYQHTFDTSRDGNVNANLHKNYENYINRITKFGITPNTEALKQSYRCSPDVCKFISDNLGIEIKSHRADELTSIVFIENESDADDIYHNNEIVKLFFKEHYKYKCSSRNWGGCKGEDQYTDVCVVLNATSLIKYKSGSLSELPAQSKNKLYVALSRARGDLYLVPDKFLKKYKLD